MRAENGTRSSKTATRETKEARKKRKVRTDQRVLLLTPLNTHNKAE